MYDVIIIGCGVTGAACAYNLARYDLRVAVLEAKNDVAAGTTKANSAIIHAGYDPRPGTLMAKLNVRGCALAPELCQTLDVPYVNNGSLVLAFTDEEMESIANLLENGRANGVEQLGYSTMPLAIRFFIAGWILALIRAVITEKFWVFLAKREGLDVNR